MKALHRILLILLLVAGTSLPSADAYAWTVTYCPKWQYSFTDRGKGEDALLHSSGQTYGVRSAACTYAYLRKNGATLHEGFLNSSGCFPPVTREYGYYEITLETLVQAPNNATFDVRSIPNLTYSKRGYYIATHLHHPQNNNISLAINVGASGDPRVSVAAMAVQFATESHIGLDAGDNYLIVAANENPLNTSFAQSVYKPSTGILYIGHTGGVTHAQSKYTIAHELGHAVQHRRIGIFPGAYSAQTTGACGCLPHVPTSEADHCLQSIEPIGAAQNEGFGHFIAADAMNDDGQSDAVFVYYKNVDWGGTEGLKTAPVTVDVRNKRRWQVTKCGSTSAVHGVELDWMNFYSALHTVGTSGKFSYDDMKATYASACGSNGCTNTEIQYGNLLGRVTAIYGSNSAREIQWEVRGADYGVDH